jgi:hypothetical protein
MTVFTSTHLVPKLKMTGALSPPPPQQAFMARTEEVLLFILPIVNKFGECLFMLLTGLLCGLR